MLNKAKYGRLSWSSNFGVMMDLSGRLSWRLCRVFPVSTYETN